MQTIYLDISNKGVVPTVYAKQNDVGRKFAVILTDSGLPYIPANGSAFSVWYKGASGEGNYTDIGDKSAFSLNGNKVEVEMIVQMLSAHGDGVLCLTLNSPDGNQISSWNIPYLCEIVPGAESEKAEEYYTAFSESVEKLKQVTENLTPEAIGAAPAGYGLGAGTPTTARSLAELDDLTLSGNYRLSMGWEKVNNVDVANASIRVDTVIDDGSVRECFQTMKPLGTNAVLVRYLIGGEWSPFECVAGTEPMVFGLEYRTTERWNNKPVYTKLDNLGTTESAGSKQFSAPNIDKLIRIVPNVDGYVPTEWDSSGTGASAANSFYFLPERVSSGVAMYVVCGANRVGKTLYVQAWYTKV